jgi:hypothetical protein
MATHRFTVGQAVRFSPDRGQEQEHTRGALFKIVRLLPEAGSMLQYRVKSEIDGQERVVRKTNSHEPEDLICRPSS